MINELIATSNQLSNVTGTKNNK